MIIRSVFRQCLSYNNQWMTIGIGVTAPGIPCLKCVPQTMDFHSSANKAAARRGTRARKAKGKIKREERIRPFLRRLEASKNLVTIDKRPFDKSHYNAAIDDVYFYKKYQVTQWDFKEAVQNHREIHHPTVYNVPNAQLILRIDMDFRYPNRPQKCMDPWRGLIEMKAPFTLPGVVLPTILAIVPNEGTYIEQTLAAGAEVVGGLEIIKAIQQGKIRSIDYEFIVCHPLVVPEMTPIRGLVKRNFPSFKSGTIDTDVPAAVRRLKSGLKIQVVHHEKQPDYAYIQTPIGTLDMDASGLEENFESILRDILPRRVAGKSPNDFIIQCLLKTPNSFEEFKVNIQDLIARNVKKGSNVVPDAEDEKLEDEEMERDTVSG